LLLDELICDAGVFIPQWPLRGIEEPGRQGKIGATICLPRAYHSSKACCQGSKAIPRFPVDFLLVAPAPCQFFSLPHSSLKERMPDNPAKPKVLVADDERVIADTLAMILNQSGFEARAVYSGEKALEIAPSFQPDMLISDVIMADLNGIDAAIRIRVLVPRIKILLFSGQAATADLLENARTKGYEFEILAKPVHPQDLLTKLRG
jgi:CheY-like chemotaxis protein